MLDDAQPDRESLEVVVYFLRHAKAEPHALSGRDEDRALTPHGEQQAAFIAKALAELSPPLHRRPEVVLTSPAVRASETARIVAAALGLAIECKSSLGLDARAREVAHLAEQLIDEKRPTLIVGHNPTLEMAVALLARDARQQPLRTGELVVIEDGQGAPHRIVARLRLDD